MSRAEVEAVRAVYPGFDKSLLTKCRNPDKYGVEPTKTTRDILRGVQGHRSAEEKPLPIRRKITLELSAREFALLQRQAKSAGEKRSVWAKKTLLEAVGYAEQTEVQAG